ncbi:hypothetical protein [Thiofilum flexile]|uniref:hypothetical protein n=1 Tax=Thiofilum flexile TaxID=125627 RepID=UPI0003663CF4|nr:hypothetical protein [Thiofilum flexile]
MRTLVLTAASLLLTQTVLAGNPEDWVIRGNGPIIDGQRFSLCSLDQKGCLRYKDRDGVNLTWTSEPNNFARIERPQGGDQPLKCNEPFALFIEKEYLINERQNFGIDLSTRTRNSGFYIWHFGCTNGQVQLNEPMTLSNNVGTIVGCRRAYGVNLCWTGDVLSLPLPAGNVRIADKKKLGF